MDYYYKEISHFYFECFGVSTRASSWHMPYRWSNWAPSAGGENAEIHQRKTLQFWSSRGAKTQSHLMCKMSSLLMNYFDHEI